MRVTRLFAFAAIVGVASLGFAVALASRAEKPLFNGMKSPLALGKSAANAGKTSADCGQCHSEIYRQWQQSQHAQSFADPYFQNAFAKEPYDSCRHCHAPTAKSVDDTAGLTEAVGCLTCHVRDGQVLAAEKPAQTASQGAAPHPILRTAKLNDTRACATCHEFGFLAAPVKYGKPRFESMELQQTTLSEWHKSSAGAAKQPCQNCHMGPKLTDHTMPGHTPEMLQQAVKIDVSLHKSGQNWDIAVTLLAAQVGHAVPTGELFRRLEWCAFDASGAAVARESFGRTWNSVVQNDRQHGAFRTRVLDVDTRVMPLPAAAQVRKLVIDAGLLPVRWQLDWVRAEGAEPPGLAACRRGTRVEVARGVFAE